VEKIMNAIDVFSARDLRNRSGELLNDAEEGRLSIITKHGRPTAIALPFDAELIDMGVHKRLAIALFSNNLLTLGQSAKLADMSIEQFLELLKPLNINVVDHPIDDLADDLAALQ
jgi:prevent-host-death family protein